MNIRDLLSGALVILAGAVATWLSSAHAVGTPAEMGPGFFPFYTGILMMALGAITLLKALASRAASKVAFSYRNMAGVGSAIVLFGLILDGLGFPLAIFFLALVAQVSVGQAWMRSALTAVILAAASTGIFYYGLGMQVRLLGRWVV